MNENSVDLSLIVNTDDGDLYQKENTESGIVFSLDHWVFGNFIDGIQAANEASLTLSGLMASILYGGIIEELLMRLFFMTLIAFIIWKLLFRK